MSASASTSTNPRHSSSQHSIPSAISPSLPSLPSLASSSQQSSPSLPHSPETQRQIAEARVALEASISNIGSSLDSSLRSRAQNLHANSAQLEKQQKDVIRATEGLRKEGEKLRKLADEGSRKVKELGNVQNWAEMLERDFLVLQETLKLANEPSDSDWETDSYTGSEGGDERSGSAKLADPKLGGHDVGPMALDKRAMDSEGDTDMDGIEALKEGKEKDNIEGSEVSMEGTEKLTEAVGGSSTATTTIGSGSDPSSGSVHTIASAAS